MESREEVVLWRQYPHWVGLGQLAEFNASRALLSLIAVKCKVNVSPQNMSASFYTN
jgi:hypothetical protein